MPRNGSGVYSAPVGTTATTLTTIDSADYNAFVADLVNDANAVRPINAGGTGGSTASGARTALGIGAAGVLGVTGADTAAVTGTAGTDGNLVAWNADGDAVDASVATSAVVTLTGTQTLTNKILTSPTVNSPTIATPTVNIGSDATGDILYRSGGGGLTRLGVGSNGQVLTLAAGVPTWAAAASSNELGNGQTWQTPTRSTSTSYQNTTGRSIMVAVTGGAGGGDRALQVSSDNSTWVTVGWVATASEKLSASAVIPDDYYYRVNGTVTIEEWAELR